MNLDALTATPSNYSVRDTYTNLRMYNNRYENSTAKLFNNRYTDSTHQSSVAQNTSKLLQSNIKSSFRRIENCGRLNTIQIEDHSIQPYLKNYNNHPEKSK